MTFYYIINLNTGLTAKSISYDAAVRYAKLIKGVVINARCPFVHEIVKHYRMIWESGLKG